MQFPFGVQQGDGGRVDVWRTLHCIANGAHCFRVVSARNFSARPLPRCARKCGGSARKDLRTASLFKPCPAGSRSRARAAQRPPGRRNRACRQMVCRDRCPRRLCAPWTGRAPTRHLHPQVRRDRPVALPRHQNQDRDATALIFGSPLAQQRRIRRRGLLRAEASRSSGEPSPPQAEMFSKLIDSDNCRSVPPQE